MFIRLNKRKGQSTLEYAVIIGVVVGALIMMQVYVKRAYQGRLKRESDSVGQQYSPGHTTSNSNVTTTANSVTYTGGKTNSADMDKVITGTVTLQQGVSVTVSNSAMTSDSREVIDSLGSEQLYTTKP